MKTLKLILIAIFAFLLFFAGCIVNINGDSTLVVPQEGESIFKLAAGAVVAVYELVVRLIPTVNDYSVVSWIIRWLKKVSDTLNYRI